MLTRINYLSIITTATQTEFVSQSTCPQTAPSKRALTERGSTPAALTKYGAAQLSSGCSCLGLARITRTSTITPASTVRTVTPLLTQRLQLYTKTNLCGSQIDDRCGRHKDCLHDMCRGRCSLRFGQSGGMLRSGMRREFFVHHVSQFLAALKR